MLFPSGTFLLLALHGQRALSAAVPSAPPIAEDAARSKSLVARGDSAPPLKASAIARTGWKATCDGDHPGNECNDAIDGKKETFWHSPFAPPTDAPLPHTITIDMGKSFNVAAIAMLPRQDGNTNGYIAEHQVFLSNDADHFGDAVAYGTWFGDESEKFSIIEPIPARYVKLVAKSEAKDKAFTSIAEFNIYQVDSYTPPRQGVGAWNKTIDMPIVPVAVAINPLDGTVLGFSSHLNDRFTGPADGLTLTATWDPTKETVTQRTVTNTHHDMFCPGLSMDAHGQVIVTGGNSAKKTSIFDFPSNNWNPGPDMNIARGYQSTVTVSDGKTFVIGGSWSGGFGDKDGEIYDPATKAWKKLPGCKVEPMLTKDQQGAFRSDNHAWLFSWKGHTVFQGGPSTAMNWYSTTNGGETKPAGNRADDKDSMCGTASMYDAGAGKILTLGGSTSYQGADSTSAAHIITLGEPNQTAQVAKAGGGNMHHRRIFHNSVIMPDGNVFIIGGNDHGEPFSDEGPSLIPEIYDTKADKFTEVLAGSQARGYHSVAILLKDGKILTGGGGLCGDCETNHFNYAVYTPQYLLNGPRPEIASVSVKEIKVGGTFTFTTKAEIKCASLIRAGSATHTVNTDQRRWEPKLKCKGGNTYEITLPKEAYIVIAGYWFLFALDEKGVPSVAETIKITLP